MVHGGRPFRRNLALLVGLTVGVAAVAGVVARSSSDQWWTGYGNGPDNGRYVSSRQIDKSNVSRLSIAWTYPYGDTGSHPIVVRGVVVVYALPAR